VNRIIQPAPIRRSVTVKAPPEKAFDVFIGRISDWWPRGLGSGPTHRTVVIEPRSGGGWYYETEDGGRHDWGRVLDYAPPSRLLLGWQFNAQFKFDPDFLTEVEVTFEAQDDGSTLVTLEHRNLERFAEAAEKTKASLEGGWPTFLQAFADFMNSEED
jgi:uncharacterized protein YndB with AHSA1/START domain